MASILIVEDDGALARLLSMQFQRNDCSVDITPTAELAMVNLADRRYDVAMIDITLPASSGIYVIDAIRSLPAERRPQVIVMTATVSSILTKIDRGLVRAVLFKPLDTEAVVAFAVKLASGAVAQRSVPKVL